MLAKKQFIKDMKPEVEAYMYNVATNVPGFTADCAKAIMDQYPVISEKAIVQLTMIASKMHPEAYCMYVVSNACSAFLLDPANDGVLFNKPNMTPLGSGLLNMYQAVLKQIESDKRTPAGKHNQANLDFVKGQLLKRMK